jgi:hypothetical protein
VIAGRDQHVRRLRGVVVDDQIERDRVVLLGEGVEDEVLDPDAGMEELRLMTGDEEVRLRVEEERFAGRGEIRAGGLERLGAGRGSIGGKIAENRRGVAQERPVAPHERTDFRGGGQKQKLAVVARRPQARQVFRRHSAVSSATASAMTRR